MEISEFRTLSLKDLIKYLSKHNIDANIEFAFRIVHNYHEEIEYFLGDFSDPILAYISNHITQNENVRTEYYQYLGRPFDEDGANPEWRSIQLYKANNGCSLNSYVNGIACRYFCRITNAKKKRAEKEVGLIENLDYNALLKCDRAEEDFPIKEEDPNNARVRRAFEMLDERDKMTLSLLVVEAVSGLEAFDVLSDYMNPEDVKDENGNVVITGREAMKSWTNKQKQDSVALLKGRAIKHLSKIFNQL